MPQRPGYNPIRRNRNIGTERAGHGQNNRLVIPEAWADSRIYYEKLIDPVEVPIVVGSVSMTILVEPPTTGFVHACTTDDIERMLQLIPQEHFRDIKLIVLRQPKRKERILSSVWGRLVYWANIGKFSGPAIYLEAQKANFTSHWSNSSTPDQAREDERLREDGHIIVADKRRHRLNSSLDSVRRTQLYRTLPHEVGHYVQYLRKVEEPSRDDLNKWMQLNARYHQIPSQEKEAFAHRYADEFRQRMFQESRLPFDRILDENRLKQQGLSLEWFREPVK